MKNIGKLSIALLLFLISFSLTNCKRDAIIPEPDINSEIKRTIPEASDVNQFIWYGLHDYYLWTGDVANLSATKFSKADSLNDFLNKYSDPEELFYSLLYKYEVVDKWSFIVEDYSEIDNWVSGISTSMGYDFMLARIGETNNFFGFVRYVLKDSPAEKAGLKRGDFFTKVNGTQLTASNYYSLLFGQESYTLTMVNIANNIISENGQTLSMTAVELQENPIFLTKVFDINGSKVGYLVYNSFTSDFDIDLNNAFKDLKDQGAQKLIVDLRYNGGGSVQTAIYLASMIHSTDKTKVFAKSVYNSLLQEYLVQEYGEDYLIDKFTDKIEAVKDDAGKVVTAEATINSLNLSEVYFIVSDNTASASELLINGLKPHMTVKTIGINTTGKYVGSITVKDYNEKGVLNTSHKWAMQPIVVKIANSQGITDYVNGLSPDIKAKEDIINLLPFGDENETLLKVALDDIRGLAPKQATFKSGLAASKVVGGRKDQLKFSNEMYINPDRIRPVK